MNKRQESSIRTRASILEAGKRILKTKQAGDVTIEEITKEAGVSKGCFYLYFENKPALIQAISELDFHTISDEAISESDPLEQRLSDYIGKFVRIIENSGLEMCRNWCSDVITHGNGAKFDEDLEAMKRILNDSISRGELEDDAPVNDIASSIVSSVYGTMMVWCLDRCDFGDSVERMLQVHTIPLIRTYMR